jgi:hypothetical protein
MRSKNEGSIYQVPGGWRASICTGRTTASGRPQRKAIQRKTRQEVEIELAALLEHRRPATSTFVFSGAGQMKIRAGKDSISIVFRPDKVVTA